MTRLLRWEVLIASVLFLAGCSKSIHEPGEKYYLVAANIKLPYWQTAASGFYAGARQMGTVAAEMVGPDTYDPAAESAAFKDAVSKKPAGILVSAADPNVLKSDIDSAIASGIPVITMDADSPDSKRLFFIGTNNYEAGRLGAQVLVKNLKGPASVVVYTMPTQLNLADRLKGYRDVLADHPNIKITQVVDIKGDPSVAFDTTKNLVTGKGKPPDAFVCLEASSCQEVADVLDRNSVRGKTIVAMDTNDDTMNWIKKGGISATIAQKPYSMGLIGIDRLDDIHHHKPASLEHDWKDDTLAPYPAFVDTGAVLIDNSNLASFQAAQQSAKQSNSAQ